MFKIKRVTLYSKSKQVTGYCIDTVQTIKICGFFYPKKDIIGKNSRKSISQNEITANHQRQFFVVSVATAGYLISMKISSSQVCKPIQSNLALRTFSVRAILVLKVKIVLILTVIYYINHQLLIGDLVLKVKQVLILTILKAKFDCILPLR